MVRPKEFDPAKVLEKAMQVFWRQGYECTSIQDLVDSMGINRQSLYDTFGGKQELFLAALDRYCTALIRNRLEDLKVPGPPLGIIRQFFRAEAEELSSKQGRRGCLLVNATVERGLDCAETAKRARAINAEIEAAFHDALERARQAGDWKPRCDTRALARFFACSLEGLVVMARAGANRPVLDDVVEVLLSVLD